MARRQYSIDRQPGAPPDIRTDGGGVTFAMFPPGAPHHDQLVIRCDADGEAWASIRPGRTVSDRSRRGLSH
jgi:hypothetical protein